MKKINTSKSLIFGREYKDIKNSLEYLNQDGYFSNRKDFSDYTEGKLDVVEVADFRFRPYAFINDGDCHVFSYFIPKSEVVFAGEKPLRPFKSLEEFFNVTGFKVGDIVQIKRFGNLNYEETAMLIGTRLYIDDKPNRVEICFGSTPRNLSVLCKNCKYFKNGEWLPFGVEEERD